MTVKHQDTLTFLGKNPSSKPTEFSIHFITFELLKIEEIIYQQLITQDCVVLPGLGGFVANNQGAKYDRLRHKFSPPTRVITFNRNLSANDGVLLQAIAEQLEVELKSASTLLNAFVADIQKAIKDKSRFELKNLGVFYMQSGKLFFERRDEGILCAGNYGLQSFVAQPMQRKKAPINKPLPKTAEQATIIIGEKTRKRRLTALPLIMLVCIFGAYFFWLLSETPVGSPQFQMSDLNPFTTKICEEYQTRANSVDYDEFETDSPIEWSNAETAVVETSLFYADEAEYGIFGTIAVADSTYVAIDKTLIEANIQLPYHVIAGCFSVPENAKNLVLDYQKLGYNSSVVDQKGALNYVSARSFATRSEAIQFLSDFKLENSGAWLLVKK